MVTYLTHLLTTPRREKFDETIEEILNKFQYQHLREYGDIVEKATEKINRLIEGLLRSANFEQREIAGTVSSISNGVIVIGTILIALIVIFMIFRIKKMVKKDEKIKRILGEIIDEKTTEEGLKKKAIRYKELGEYREAIRYSFISLLFQIHEKNLLYLDEAQTNSEIIAELRRNNFMDIELFQRAAELFNEAWYGRRIVNEQAYKSWEDIVVALENGVRSVENKR